MSAPDNFCSPEKYQVLIPYSDLERMVEMGKKNLFCCVKSIRGLPLSKQLAEILSNVSRKFDKSQEPNPLHTCSGFFVRLLSCYVVAPQDLLFFGGMTKGAARPPFCML